MVVSTERLVIETQDMINGLYRTDPATKRRLMYYAKTEILRAYVNTCRFVVNQIPDYKHTVGLDFGCELGVCAYMLSLFGCHRVYCYDHSPIERIINQIPNLFYTDPWTRKYNWIFMNDVLYLNTPDAQQEIIRNAIDCLAPDGVLIISDEDSDSINRNRVARWCQDQVGGGVANEGSTQTWKSWFYHRLKLALNPIHIFSGPNWKSKLYHRIKRIRSNRFYVVSRK